MIRDVIKNETFFSHKAGPATPDDLPIAQDLLDNLTAHKGGCVDMVATMISVNKRIIAFDNKGKYMVIFNPEIVKNPSPTGRRNCLATVPAAAIQV